MAQGRLLNWLAPMEQAASIIRRQPAAAVQPVWIAAAAAVALDLCGAIVHLLNSIAGVAGHAYWLGNSLAAASFALLGALVLTHRPGHRLGTLFVAGGLFTAAGVAAGELGPYGLLVGLDWLPGAVFLAWVGNWIWSLGTGVIGVSLLFFPDGHLAAPRWRLVLAAFAVGVGLAMVGDALMPGPMRLMPGTNPVGLQGAAGFLDLLRWTGAALQVGSMLAAVIDLLVRLRSARGVEREQIRWFAYAGAVSLGLLVGGIMLDGYIGVRVLGPIGGSLGPGMVLPAALTVAVLRYRLFALDRLINRTLVYGLLSLGVAVLYVSAVGYAAATLQGGGATAVSLLLTAAVAVAFQPLREQLQRAVNRLLYGQRDEPYTVVSELGRRLEASLAPETVLSTIVHTLASALNVPYAALSLSGDPADAPSVSTGSPVPTLVRVPLIYQHLPVGELLLATRGDGEAFTPSEEELLRDLARQSGVAVHAVRLTADLQQARERLVSSREEERRRLRRDLHDGLGPQLASLPLSIEAARTLIPRDPEAADTVLRQLREHVQTAIADIRGLVYALRPPQLDDLGLLAAIGDQVDRAAIGGLQICVEAPDRLPDLPAAVEVAAFRIVQEALTNVLRHSGARRCTVRIECTLPLATALRLIVDDDGSGLPPDVRPGVGLGSMRERATEVGGTCQFSSRQSGGTRVEMALPLGVPVQGPTQRD